MCLFYTLEDHPGYRAKVAEEDITCYKIVKEYDKEEGKYTSPRYKRKKWEIGKTYTNKGEKGDFACAVYGGFYHTYKSKAIAECLCKEYPGKTHVAKCAIPKGTIYYVGFVNNTEIRGYASRKLKIDEICV